MGGGRAHEGRPPEHCSICSRQREPPWRRRPVAGPACEPRTGIPRAAAAAVAGEPADELGDSTPSLGSAGWRRFVRRHIAKCAITTRGSISWCTERGGVRYERAATLHLDHYIHSVSRCSQTVQHTVACSRALACKPSRDASVAAWGSCSFPAHLQGRPIMHQRHGYW